MCIIVVQQVVVAHNCPVILALYMQRVEDDFIMVAELDMKESTEEN